MALAKQLEYRCQTLEKKITTASLSCRIRKPGSGDWGEGMRKTGQDGRVGEQEEDRAEAEGWKELSADGIGLSTAAQPTLIDPFPAPLITLSPAMPCSP